MFDCLLFSVDETLDYDDDPTLDDNARIIATSKLLDKITKFLAGSNSANEYVPCTITITGLAMVPQHGSHIKSAVSKFPFYKPPKKERFRMLAGGLENNSAQSLILLGSPDSIARLTMSTIWTSPVSTRMVWQFLEGRSGKYLKLAISRSFQVDAVYADIDTLLYYSMSFQKCLD